MKKRNLIIAGMVLLLFCLSGCAAEKENSDTSTSENVFAALVPQKMAPNAVTPNPYMANSDNSVHNDTYSSDVTNAVLPLGINSQLNLSLETQNPQAPSAAFYDEDGNAVTPYIGGVAIADMSGDTVLRKGVFVPSQHDGENYRVQISYSFVDSYRNVVLPTSHGHIIILRTKDEKGEILPVFQKIMDVNVVEIATRALGNEIDQNLLSIVYDYNGNLWFVTGGFRIYPDRSPAGFMGYLSQEYIRKTLNGEKVNPEKHVHLYKFEEGESAENGISSNEHGAVILTNKACYMLEADNGVKVLWRTGYESNGTNDAKKDSEYTGGGLAYGSGTTPTLTKDLVLFTDNLDPVNLIALSAKTGEVAATVPVLDQLGTDVPVSVENSILVYSGSEERTSVLVCNWFGAGNAGLRQQDADSSVQTYANIYDENWTNEGGKYLAPGVERVDIVKDGNAYTGEKVWFREDIRDTAMIKLSTATGYFYGYWQDMDTGMWCYEVLDFETGETVYALPVSDLPEYNNMAVGMIADVKGNTLYCPTNNMEMVRWQDEFAYLPDSPAKKLDLNSMERYNLSEDDFKKMSGTELTVATYLMKATVNNIAKETTIVFQVNGLDKKASDYTLLYKDAKGNLKEYEGTWSLCDLTGKEIDADTKLQASDLIEIRFTFEDGGKLDIDDTEKKMKVSVCLAF